MKYISCVIIFLNALTIKAQTSIIIQTKDSIFVGAGSKSGNVNTGSNQPVSKIHIVNKYNYVVIGYPEDKIISLADWSCKKGNNINEVINSFIDTLKKALFPVIEDIRANNKKKYLSRFDINDVCTVSFFGFENNSSYINTVHLKAINKPNKIVEFGSTIEATPFDVLGMNDEIYAYLAKKKLLDSDFLCQIDSLIKIEINSHPEKVGLPIDLLLITKNGTKWIRNKRNKINNNPCK